MDIYNYFVSPDIAAHCKNIGHVFNPLEMAVIIALSKKTVKEKHAAWREIITDYPDMPIHESNWFRARESLHGFLREQIAWEEKRLADFYTPGKGAVYRPYTVWKRHDRSSDMGCYSTAEKAWAEICENVGDWEENRITRAEIYKDFIDGDYGDDVWLNSDGEAFLFSRHGEDPPGELESIFIHIPLPFEKGDLVAFVGYPENTPCVLIHLPHWNTEHYNEQISGKASDGTDMIAWVHFMDDEGQLTYNDNPYFLWELKFFTGTLKGYDRFLRYLSDYMKNKYKNINSLIYALNKIKSKTDAEANNTLTDSGFRNWARYLEAEDAEQFAAHGERN